MWKIQCENCKIFSHILAQFLVKYQPCRVITIRCVVPTILWSHIPVLTNPCIELFKNMLNFIYVTKKMELNCFNKPNTKYSKDVYVHHSGHF